MFLFATVALLQVGAFEGDPRVWLGLIGGVCLSSSSASRSW